MNVSPCFILNISYHKWSPHTLASLSAPRGTPWVLSALEVPSLLLPAVGDPGNQVVQGPLWGSPLAPAASTGVSPWDPPAADETRVAPAAGAQLPNQLLPPRNLERELGAAVHSLGACREERTSEERTSEDAMPPFHLFNTSTQCPLCAPHWGCRREKRNKTLPPVKRFAFYKDGRNERTRDHLIPDGS